MCNRVSVISFARALAETDAEEQHRLTVNVSDMENKRDLCGRCCLLHRYVGARPVQGKRRPVEETLSILELVVRRIMVVKDVIQCIAQANPAKNTVNLAQKYAL